MRNVPRPVLSESFLAASRLALGLPQRPFERRRRARPAAPRAQAGSSGGVWSSSEGMLPAAGSLQPKLSANVKYSET